VLGICRSPRCGFAGELAPTIDASLGVGMVGGVKALILLLVVVVGQSVLAADKKPLTKEESAKAIEAAIRRAAQKPEGKLTEADLGKITFLALIGTKTPDEGLKEVVKCVSPVASPF
tara:strand:- start:74 stop:424 length:351 start_codon:yes stop_codon:yes gene_type:complete